MHFASRIAAALITPLEKVTTLGAKPIETESECRLQPVHPVAQVWHGRSERHVKVISQQAKSVNGPIKAGAGFSQGALERLGRTDRIEQIATIVAAIDDMINCPGKLNAKSACHPPAHR
jgi:hypothetical protein